MAILIEFSVRFLIPLGQWHSLENR